MLTEKECENALTELEYSLCELEETEPDDELLKQVEEMKRGLNRET